VNAMDIRLGHDGTRRAGPAAQARRRRGVVAELLVLCALGFSGCVSRAEFIALREGMDRGTMTIRQQHKQWAGMLAEGGQTELPTLSAAGYRAVLTAHREYEDLVRSSRAHDSASSLAEENRD